MSYATSVIKSIQTVSTTISVASGFTGNKDVTITAVANTAKCRVAIQLPGGLSGANSGISTVPGNTKFTINASPTLTSTTNLRWVIATNQSNGDGDLFSSVQIVEYY